MPELRMMETVVAALVMTVQMSRDRQWAHGETLIRSACETLAQTSPGLVAAVTVSLPAEGLAQINWLRATACSLAAKYEFDAALTEENAHISVRLTRRQDCGGRQ